MRRAALLRVSTDLKNTSISDWLRLTLRAIFLDIPKDHRGQSVRYRQQLLVEGGFDVILS